LTLRGPIDINQLITISLVAVAAGLMRQVRALLIYPKFVKKSRPTSAMMLSVVV